ncbi:MAG TPA: hypothetical protein VLH80_07610 [Nitrospiraceae bacterium]|nr:hypothetical protein [Nitrospiraceae bacterium]
MKHSPPKGDHHTRHPLSHHTDHSGAHVRGTHHHMSRAHIPTDGLTESEGGEHEPMEAGEEAGDSPGFSRKGNEGKSDMHLSEHPTKLELPALHHNQGDQE